MNWKTEAMQQLVAEIQAAGFRVFVAASGTYGFYTDKEGTRVISFGVDFGETKFHGNYITSDPRSTGTGWRIGESRHDITTDFAAAFSAHPPRWAVGGPQWKFTTLAKYLDAYQASSKFTEAICQQ